MKIAYVSVRYGPTIHGGAEQACRQLAEHLAAADVEVSVYTTCATDAVTWDDDLPAGTAIEGGVTVHRFTSTSGRHRHFDELSGAVLADPRHQSPDVERRWLDAQGPICPDLVAAVTASDADLVVCTPYLYWPTVEAVARVGRRAVLHPAAHDEPAIRLPMFAETFRSATGLAFYTDSERRLVERLWPSLAATPQLVVGLGVSTDATTASDDTAFAADGALGGRPYVLCLGRVDDGKGADLLARFFVAYKRRRPGPLALVFAGPIVNPPPAHPDIVVTGPLAERSKWDALAGAEMLINPSANESFSIVLLEAWAAGRPALVNARCAATVEHARRSRAGVTFAGYGSFEAAVDRLLADRALAAAMGAAGRSYVEECFAWPVVTQRYRRWLQHLATTRVH
ncbi:MAG: glycosyltransferase family 4 protein [Acidimicrobiales bacterium]